MRRVVVQAVAAAVDVATVDRPPPTVDNEPCDDEKLALLDQSLNNFESCLLEDKLLPLLANRAAKH